MSLLYPEISDVFVDFIEFLDEHKADFIIGGGTAIDYALKHKGHEGIYDSNVINDYDLFTYNLELVFDLAEKLMTKYQNIKVINAFHPQTLKVRFNRTDVTDVSLLPKKYFDQLPTISYQGYKVIHPLVKMIDIHKAFLCPNRGSPNEAIFHRFEKDMSRYLLLQEVYPVVSELPKGNNVLTYDLVPKSNLFKLAVNDQPYLLSGLLAYALIEQHFSLATKGERHDIVKANLRAKGASLIMDAPKSDLNDRLLLIALDLNSQKTDGAFMSPFLDDYIPRSIVEKKVEYHCPNTEVTFCSLTFEDKTFDILNIHGLMLWFLAMHIKDKNDDYLAYYTSLQTMINVANKFNLGRGEALELPYFINVNIWKEKNSPEMLIKGLEMRNRFHNIQEPIWPLPAFFPNQPRPVLQGHILLELGYDELKHFKEYKKLEQYGGLF